MWSRFDVYVYFFMYFFSIGIVLNVYFYSNIFCGHFQGSIRYSGAKGEKKAL